MKKRKGLSGLLAVLFVMSVTIGFIAYAADSMKVTGDANGDGVFDVGDLVRMKRYQSSENAQNSTSEQTLFYSNDFSGDIMSVPDPYILYDDGYFYLYSTETRPGVFQAYRSKDLNDWESLGVIYQRSEDYWGEGCFWAPKVVKNPADGRYYMYTSCQGNGRTGLPEGTSLDTGSEKYARPNLERLHLTVLVSDSPAGPFTEWVGERPNIQKYYHGQKTEKGDTVTYTSGPMFDFANAPAGWVTNEKYFNKNGTNIFAQLDPYPFFDEDGTFYLYFVRSRDFNQEEYRQGVWGVKMIDMVTPDYATLTCLTMPGYYKVVNKESDILHFLSKSDPVMDDTFVNEGCCMQRHTTVKADGTEVTMYYLTYSRSGYGDPYYATCVAVADAPLGYAKSIVAPNGGFVKLEPQYGNPVHYIDATKNKNNTWIADANYDIFQSTGNSMFFTVGEEEFLVSHCVELVSGKKIRSFVIDRVTWQYNETLGYDVPHSNGPTQGSLQPLPASVTGYENVAAQATISSNKSGKTDLLKDGYVAIHARDDSKVYYADKNDLCITLKLDEAKTLRAAMIYNAYDEEKAFSSVEKIELLRENHIVKTIVDVPFPKDYLTAGGELRPGGAAVSVFSETVADTVKIYISEAMTSTPATVGIAEIVLLGENEAQSNMQK